MAIPPVSSAPSLLPHPVQAAQQPVPDDSSEVIQLLEVIEKKPKLNLRKAKELFRQIQERSPKLIKIAPIVFLQIEFFNKLHTLKRNLEIAKLQVTIIRNGQKVGPLKMSQLLDQAILTSFSIFREWRKVVKDANSWLLARATAVDLKQEMDEIIAILEHTKLRRACEELMQFSEIIQHLAQAQDFLESSLKPLTERVESMFTPQIVNFYEEALAMCAFGADHLKSHFEFEFCQPFQKHLATLEQHPELETLRLLVSSYYQETCNFLGEFCTRLSPFIAEMRHNPVHEAWKKSVDQLVFLDAEYAIKAALVQRAFQQLLAEWHGSIAIFYLDDQNKMYEPRRKMHEKVITSTCKTLDPKFNHLGQTTLRLLKSHSNLTGIVNSCGVDTYRIPCILMQQGKESVESIDVALHNFGIVLEITQNRFPHYQFIGINTTDLLMHWSLEIFKDNPKVEKRLKNFVCAIAGLELYEGICHEDRDASNVYRKSMCRAFEALFQEMTSTKLPADFELILKALRAVIPPEEMSPSLRDMGFACFFSLFYHPLGGNLEKIQWQEEIAFMQKTVLLEIAQFEAIVEQNALAEVKEILQQQPGPFWKSCYQLLNMLDQELHALHGALKATKARIATRSDLPSLLSELRSWQKIQNRHLDSEATPAFNALQQVMAHIDGANRCKELLDNIARNLTFASFSARPFQKLIELTDLFAEETQVKKRATAPAEERSPRKETVEEEEIPENGPTIAPPELTEEAPLLALQMRSPIAVDHQEDSYLLFKRHEKMANSLQTHFYLLALLEEQKRAPYLKSLFRAGTDAFRLLEMTEKLALAYLPIPESQSHQHLHDGVFLSQVLAKVEPLFGKMELKSAAEAQEKALKVSYWFSEDERDVEGIASKCRAIWVKLVDQPAPIHERPFFASFRLMKAILHRKLLRSRQNAFPIPLELPPLGNLLSSLEQALPDIPNKPELKETLNRIVTLTKRLNEHRSKGSSAPILFANRHAEIQIGILTTVMKCRLAAIGELDGPTENRPLIHSHNVLDLWQALKGGDEMVAKLTLFVGDPRYPYPNKTAISNDLVTSFELSKLQECVKTGFWNHETQALFKRHCVGKSVEEKVAEHLEQVERKSRFALQLALEMMQM